VLLDQLGTVPPRDVLLTDITQIATGRLGLPALIDAVTRSRDYGARFGAG